MYFSLFLLLLLKIFPGAFSDCYPEVEIERCYPSKNQSNLYWNLDRNREFSISLKIRRSCKNSVIRIQWLLEKKDTRRIFMDMRRYNNKQVLIMDAHSLPVGEYIFLARVRESGFGEDAGIVEKPCWVRTLKSLPKLEKIAPRINGSFTTEYTLPVETNTIPTGWTHCSNPAMSILTSPGSKPPINIYFGEVATFDNWVNVRTTWVVGKSWSWYETKSRLATRTYQQQTHTGSEEKILLASTKYTDRMKNSTGHVSYPAILNDTFPRRSFFERKGREMDVITDLEYNKKYRFLLCEHGDVYTMGCRNLTELTTCPNYALKVSCTPDVANKSIFNSYSDVIGLKCTMSGVVPKHLTFGLYSLDGRAVNAKGPKDIMIGHFTNYKSVYFRLYSRANHQVNLRPVDYDTHVRFDCNPKSCKKSIAAFHVTSDVLESIDLSPPAKASKLNNARDGELPCEDCNSKLALGDLSFAGLASSGKLGDAVQLALGLLRDSEKMVMKDVERNNFQITILEELAKITNWTWPHLELMVGLLPYFEMEGMSKEIGHTKARALLMKNMFTSMKKLIIAKKHPLTMQVDMETIFFHSFFRQVSQLFDADYVKPFTFTPDKVESPPFHDGRQEDYENYGSVIDETTVDDFAVLTNDAIEALFALLFARSKTHHFKEEHLSAQEKGVTSKMWLEFQNIDYMNTEVNDLIYIKIGNPVDLPPTAKEFRFIWSLIDRNAFFWHRDHYRFATQCVMFKFYSGDEEKSKGFETNPIVQLETSLASIPVQPDGIVVPTNPNEWSNAVMDRFIRVYRIKVDKYVGYTLAIFVTKISPVDRLMMVIDQTGNKPRLTDFLSPKADPIIFNKENTATLQNVFAKGYWYIGLLPYRADIATLKLKRSVKARVEDIILTPFSKKKRVPTIGINYLFTFVMYACPMYINGSFKYDTCTVQESSTIAHLDCDCKEVGGPIAASMAAVPYKVYGIVDVPIKLELTISYVVIAFTLAALLIYCLLLILAPYRSKPAELIYFLSDNAKQSRFGYLIRVTTADFINAGTTAHIGIQLYGSNGTSKRHILNYPDPQHKLFRTTGVDHFLLATNESLDNINRMELWSDCSGFNPEWYCESVRIYDVQRYISWYFNVQKWFSVRDGYYSHYFVKPGHPRELTIRTPWVYFNLHLGPNHSWNVIDASHDLYWSYMERLTLLLTHALGTFALALYCIHPPKFEYQDGIGVTNYSNMLFFVKTIAIVTSIVAIVNYLFAVFLRGSMKSGRFRSRYGYFPTYYSYFTWAALLVINVLCLVYCLVYGPFISSAVVYDWMIVVIVSLLFNIFICENLFLAIHGIIRLAFYYLNAWVSSVGTEYIYREIITDIETQRKYLYHRTDRRGFRPYIRDLYKPLGGDLLRQRQQEEKNRSSLQHTIKSMCRIWIMLIFLIILIQFYMNERSAVMNKHLEDIFVHANFSSRSKGIRDVYTHDELYEYLNTTLVNAITPQLWYTPYTVADSGILSDISNKVIGNVRIRQQRTGMIDCPEASFAKAVGVTKCVASLTRKQPTQNSTYNKKLKHNMSMWWHHSEEFWNNYKGYLMFYNGDGYAANIGKTRQNAFYRVGLLKDNQWLDDRTKFIIIEMLVYSANTNLFADIKVVWEREAKYMYPSHYIQIVRLTNVAEETQKLNILIFVLYMIASIIMLDLVIRRICKRRFRVLKSWHDTGVLILAIFNVYSIVLFFKKNNSVNHMLKGFIHADRTKYFPYSHAISQHREFELTLAAIAFIVLLLMLQFTQFIFCTASLLWALNRAFPLFINIALYAIVALVYFGLVVHVFFGSVLEEFNNFLNSSMIFLLTFMRAGNPGLRKRMWENSGGIMVCLYICMVAVVWMTKAGYFMACSMYLRMCRKDTSAIPHMYTFQKYLVEMFEGSRARFNYICKAFKRRPHRRQGGQDEHKFVTPAPARYFYRDSIYLSEWTMKKQQQVATAYLRNTYVRQTEQRPTALDMDLMRGISEIVIGPKVQHRDLYFKQRKPLSPITTTVVVPEERMYQIARVAEQLLESRPSQEKEDLEEDEDFGLAPEESAVKVEKPKPWTEKEVWNMSKSQARRLQGLLVILDISNDVIDTVMQKLLGPLSFGQVSQLECCDHDECNPEA